jgi:hypothetical protein
MYSGNETWSVLSKYWLKKFDKDIEEDFFLCKCSNIKGLKLNRIPEFYFNALQSFSEFRTKFTPWVDEMHILKMVVKFCTKLSFTVLRKCIVFEKTQIFRFLIKNFLFYFYFLSFISRQIFHFFFTMDTIIFDIAALI